MNKIIMEQYKNMINNSKLIDIANSVANNMYIDNFGSCVHFAEEFVIAVAKTDTELLNEFDVIEGYVSTSIGDGINQQHTWIELSDGTTIDPTFAQFTKYDKNSKRIKIKHRYSGKKYYEDTVFNGDTWFTKRRKEHPEYIFKKINEKMEVDEYGYVDSSLWKKDFEFFNKMTEKEFMDYVNKTITSPKIIPVNEWKFIYQPDEWIDIDEISSWGGYNNEKRKYHIETSSVDDKKIAMFGNMYLSEFYYFLKSISENGIMNPLFIVRGKISEGNHRLEALKILGMDKVPVKYAVR